MRLKRFVVPELDGERRKIVASYLGPDSWNNWGDGHTIAGQFQARVEEYGISLSKASTDREGGLQLIYRMLKSGELVICGDTCPELVKAIPTRLHDPKKPGDIIKTPGDHYDDVVDAFRYAIYSFVTAGDVQKPMAIKYAEAMRNYDATTAWLKHAQILEELRREEEPVPYSRNARRMRQITNRRIDRSRF